MIPFDVFNTFISWISSKQSDNLTTKLSLMDQRKEYFEQYYVLSNKFKSAYGGLIYFFDSNNNIPIVPMWSYFEGLVDNKYLSGLLIDDIDRSSRYVSVINHNVFDDLIDEFQNDADTYEYIFPKSGKQLTRFVKAYSHLLITLREYDHSAKVVEEMIVRFEYKLSDNINLAHYGWDEYKNDVIKIRESTMEISRRNDVFRAIKNLNSIYDEIIGDNIEDKVKKEISIK